MPKAPSKTRTTHEHQPSQRVAQSAAASSGPSSWRASKLGRNDKIPKTHAMARYHLKAADLVGIPFTATETYVKGALRPMYLYDERAVERKAWKMCGGPEGFDAHLSYLKAQHIRKKGPNADFPLPKTYRDSDLRSQATIVSSAPGPSRNSSAPYVRSASSRLSAIKKKMPPWLWETCTRALLAVDEGDEIAMALGQGRFTKPEDRERPMRAALRLAARYPPRPEQKLPSSECVDRVRALLAEAPRAPKPGCSDWGRDDIEGVTFHSSYGPELSEEYRWCSGYLEHLFTALIQLINELGAGSAGWEGIRWEVYDKYAECMHEGPQYDRRAGSWVDWAAEWLDGRYAEVAFGCRVQCPAGRIYNDMLPFRHS